MAGEKVTTFKIYVGNVPEGATNEDIRQIFEEFGTVVECDCLGNRAFVHMEDDIEGKHAVGQLQDIELQGSKLKILESKNNIPPKTPIVKLLVKNVGPSVDARGLRNMFKRFGFVLEVELSNGVGHVCLEATGDIGSAIKEMNGKVIDDVALTVEPAPITTSTAPSPVTESDTSPAKKKFKSPNKYNGDNNSRSYNNYSDQSQWSTPSDYEAEAEWYGDEFINYSEPYVRDPYFPPPQQHFHTPERILRDPYAQQQQNAHFSRGSPRFRGPRPMAMGARGPHPVPMGARGPRPVSMGARGPRPMAMGVRGPRPVAMGPRGPRPMAVGGRGPPPLLFHRPPQGPPMMGGRVPLMRPRMPSHGHFPTPFGGHSQADNSFYTRSTEVVARNGPPPEIDRYQGQAEVFYEDEPLPSIPSRPPPRMNISEANMIPLGGSGMAYQGPTFARRGRGQPGQRGGGGRGRGRGKPQKFTALKEEISPGEKYPVPPVYNPNFRAPMKYQQDGPKRKGKKTKKPLVPAELPDYSLPVPDLPKDTVPKGAIFKPFPTPFQNNGFGSQISDMNAGASGSSNFSQRNEMDFTTDDF